MSLTAFMIVPVIVALGLVSPALAHSPAATDPQEQWAGWLSIIILGLFWTVYAIGAKRRPPRLSLLVLFQGAFVLCAFAVLGPLDEWAEDSTAAHMGQHMLFMVVVAPLFVLSRPLPQLLAGGGRAITTLLKPLLLLTRHPLWAAYIHGAVLWFWHLPFFYTLALEDPWWHIVEHACFIVSAGLFWWALLKSSRKNAPWALLALLFTMMHMGFLGAVLTFAREPFYGAGRTLPDQQLAGLIMWVMGALPYLLASLWISFRWYQRLAERILVLPDPKQ